MTGINDISETVITVEGSVQRLLNVIVLIIGTVTFSLIVDALNTISGIIFGHITRKRMNRLEKLELKLTKKKIIGRKIKKKNDESKPETSGKKFEDSVKIKKKKTEDRLPERGMSCEVIMIHHGFDSNQSIVPEHILERDRKQEAYERGFKDPPTHPHRHLTTYETEEFCEHSTKILKKKHKKKLKQSCLSKNCPNKLSPLICVNSTSTTNFSKGNSQFNHFISPIQSSAVCDTTLSGKSSIVEGKNVQTQNNTNKNHFFK